MQGKGGEEAQPRRPLRGVKGLETSRVLNGDTLAFAS